MRTVREIMSTDLKWVNRGATVRAVSGVMTMHRIGAVLVGGEGPPAIVTETDVVRRVVAAGRNPCSTFVENIMNQPVIAVAERRSIDEAGDLMAEHRIRHLAVTRNGTVIGLVSARDLLFEVSLFGVPIERMMSRLPIVVPVDETVGNAAALMTQAAASGLLVSGRRARPRPITFSGFARKDLTGILTGADVVRKVVACDHDPYVATVGEVMSVPLHTMDGRETVPEAFRLMVREGLRHVAVTTGDEITGLLSVEDIFEPAWLHVAGSPLREARA